MKNSLLSWHMNGVLCPLNTKLMKGTKKEKIWKQRDSSSIGVEIWKDKLSCIKSISVVIFGKDLLILFFQLEKQI